MRRSINKLTALQAEKLKKAGRHADGGNLYLKITPDGARRLLGIISSGFLVPLLALILVVSAVKILKH